MPANVVCAEDRQPSMRRSPLGNLSKSFLGTIADLRPGVSTAPPGTAPNGRILLCHQA